MDRILQWTWDRFATRYFWALCGLMFPIALPVYLVWSLTIVAFENSSRYGEAAVFTVVALLLRTYVLVLPNAKGLRPIAEWAAGRAADPMNALSATYAYARRGIARAFASDAIWTALFMGAVGG